MNQKKKTNTNTLSSRQNKLKPIILFGTKFGVEKAKRSILYKRTRGLKRKKILKTLKKADTVDKNKTVRRELKTIILNRLAFERMIISNVSIFARIEPIVFLIAELQAQFLSIFVY